MRFLMIFLCLLTTSVFASDLYKVTEKTIDGKDFSMSSLKGKVVLIVNIASQCGYTPQLDKLEKLYQKYKAKNFVVLGVPTNDFGGQTPEDDKGMKEFCQKNYSVTFPLLNKRTVKGEEKRPLYKYLTEKSVKDYKGDIGWNFEKFLVDKNGSIVSRYKSSVEPDNTELNLTIETLL